MQLVNDQSNLKKLIKHCHGEKFIAVDTEFDRRNTFFPKLCLLQIATSEKIFAIDMLAENLNFRALKKLLKNKKIIKIFHSAREDIETIKSNLKIMPKALFDTQIAAELLELGDAISYSKLVEVMLNKHLEKDMQFSNWLRRPLSKRQIEYAIDDVIYLYDLYIEFQKILSKRPEVAKKISEKLETAIKRQIEGSKPKNAWKKLISGRSRTDKKTLKKIVKLAEWREKRAIKLNIPRQWVITDSLIKTIAKTPKKQLETIEEIKEMLVKKKLDTKLLKEIKRRV